MQAQHFFWLWIVCSLCWLLFRPFLIRNVNEWGVQCSKKSYALNCLNKKIRPTIESALCKAFDWCVLPEFCHSHYASRCIHLKSMCKHCKYELQRERNLGIPVNTAWRYEYELVIKIRTLWNEGHEVDGVAQILSALFQTEIIIDKSGCDMDGVKLTSKPGTGTFYTSMNSDLLQFKLFGNVCVCNKFLMNSIFLTSKLLFRHHSLSPYRGWV